MTFDDLIRPECVIGVLNASGKKHALQELSRCASAVTGQSSRAIFSALNRRERLGTTGIGNGIAIPHGKLPGLDRPWGLFARLASPVDFDALDEQPVDLLFMLIAPEASADHLKALSLVLRLLGDAAIREKLRATWDPRALYYLLVDTAARWPADRLPRGETAREAGRGADRASFSTF